MARVTVEDCVDKVTNRFDLVLLAAQRAREISSGAELTIDRDRDKNPVVALREIAEESGYCDLEILADLGRHVVEFDYAGAHYVRDEHYFLVTLVSDMQIPRNKKDAGQFQVIWVPTDQAEQQLTYAAEQEVVRKAILAHRQLSGQQ